MRVTDFPTLIHPARQQVMQYPGAHLLELGNQGFGFFDGGVEGVENLGNSYLLRTSNLRDFKPIKEQRLYSLLSSRAVHICERSVTEFG